MKLLLLFISLYVATAYSATAQPWLTIPGSVSRGKVFQNKLYIAERSGILYQVQNDDSLVVVLNITDRVLPNWATGFTGFLNFAYPSWFNSIPYIFLWYGTQSTTNPTGSKTIISVMPVNTTTMRANENEEIVLSTLENPTDRHVGGYLDFAFDGTLMMGFGDGSNAVVTNVTQDPNDLHGKMLRYSVNKICLLFKLPNCILYIPWDNPDPNSAIYALGFRQPYECYMLDIQSILDGPRMFCFENGANSWEEVNYVEGGVNLGWPCTEGPEVTNITCSFPLPNQRTPLLFYPHSPPSTVENWNKFGNSVSPGFIYKGTLHPEWKNYLLFGDLSSKLWIAGGDLRRSEILGSWTMQYLPVTVPNAVISLFPGVDGEPLINTLDFAFFDSVIYKLV